MPKRREERSQQPPMLTQTVERATEALADRVRMGNELLSRDVWHGGEMETVRAEFRKWTDYNVRLLERLFTTEQLARQYESEKPGGVFYGDISPVDEFNYAREALTAEVRFLDSLLNRIDLYGPAEPEPQTAHSGRPTGNPSRVFIVHGRKEGPRESVARLLEKLGIEVIILHEQANRGGTIIEKLERHKDVHFAVVLLTGDDEGRLKGDPDPPKSRARQNVILELGYFVGFLGRQHVCALYETGVELPSDWNGVVWVPLDDSDAWKYRLGKELKAAGLAVDMNLL
jgi:predicted nucleotide-binding protein